MKADLKVRLYASPAGQVRLKPDATYETGRLKPAPTTVRTDGRQSVRTDGRQSIRTYGRQSDRTDEC
jgi:hypothetical protein